MNKTFEEKYILKRPLVFVGYMGCGKSEIGRRVVRQLIGPVSFIDSDKEIVARAGMAIPEIFARDGEAAFRASERAVIAEVMDSKGVFVLSVGGGAFVDAGTRDRIKKAGAVSIWLKVAGDILFNRVKGDKNRPLLQAKNPKEEFLARLEAREPFYRQADITVECGETLPCETARTVIQALLQKRVLESQTP